MFNAKIFAKIKHCTTFLRPRNSRGKSTALKHFYKCFYAKTFAKYFRKCFGNVYSTCNHGLSLHIILILFNFKQPHKTAQVLCNILKSVQIDLLGNRVVGCVMSMRILN